MTKEVEMAQTPSERTAGITRTGLLPSYTLDSPNAHSDAEMGDVVFYSDS